MEGSNLMIKVFSPSDIWDSLLQDAAGTECRIQEKGRHFDG